MRDMVMALAAPTVMCASGLYAACAVWWRRRRPVPAPWSQAGLRLAGERAVAVAEAVVADEHALLVQDAERTGAESGRMRHHERPVTGNRVTEGRSGEAP
ncbi:hypothetical protein [Streptomyces sp. NPDC102360]|uniref:hypothetical protein n=1 Tax=Streptomyces sp. NPDC102360 TaxID=3366160 RepID=UPI0038046C82